MNTFNGGTRGTEHPDGGPHPLDRELRGHRQAAVVAKLAGLIHEHCGIFTSESPVPCHLWESAPFVQLREFMGDAHHVATFYQFAYQCKIARMRMERVLQEEDAHHW